MQIHIEIDESVAETTVQVRAKRMDEEVEGILRRLKEERVRQIPGYLGSEIALIEPEDILRAYTQGNQVLLSTDAGEYRARLRLYELEERLGEGFIRISHSELVNLRRIRCFDLSLAGSICVRMDDGAVTYASRRYVAELKRRLGI